MVEEGATYVGFASPLLETRCRAQEAKGKKSGATCRGEGRTAKKRVVLSVTEMINAFFFARLKSITAERVDFLLLLTRRRAKADIRRAFSFSAVLQPKKFFALPLSTRPTRAKNEKSIFYAAQRGLSKMADACILRHCRASQISRQTCL